VQNLARSDQRDKTIEQVFTNALKVRIRPQMFVGHHLVRIPRRAAYRVSGGYFVTRAPRSAGPVFVEPACRLVRVNGRKVASCGRTVLLLARSQATQYPVWYPMRQVVGA
jgi:hypothetical protein